MDVNYNNEEFIFSKCLKMMPIQHLFVHIQQWKHQNNVLSMFKANKKDQNNINDQKIINCYC